MEKFFGLVSTKNSHFLQQMSQSHDLRSQDAPNTCDIIHWQTGGDELDTF